MKITRFDAHTYVPASIEDPAAPSVWKTVIFGHADIIRGSIQMISWALLPAGKTFRGHYHEDIQEIFIIVKGRPRITIDHETADLAPGDGVAIPAGAAHIMEAPAGQEDVEYIAMGISSGAGGKTIVI